MSEKKKRGNTSKIKELRVAYVATLYRKGYSYREMKKAVMEYFNLETLSLQTIHNDVDTLKKEWKESRVHDMETLLNLELSRIDDTVRELWSQWEKSKQDYTRRTETQKGSPKAKKDANGGATGEKTIETYQVEKTTQEVIQLGNVAYIAEIRAQLSERRKLLGLYAPEKREITGAGGKDLNVGVKLDTSSFTKEERKLLLEIARKTNGNTN